MFLGDDELYIDIIGRSALPGYYRHVKGMFKNLVYSYTIHGGR